MYVSKLIVKIVHQSKYELTITSLFQSDKKENIQIRKKYIPFIQSLKEFSNVWNNEIM